MVDVTGPLHGVRVLDLTRILAGPFSTQMLGDLGAEVIKIERPGSGDDTRKFAPPFLVDERGTETSESAYFLSANRNKKSVAIDYTKSDGQKLIRRLMAKSDVVVENFKTGTLKKYDLSYDNVKSDNPRLVYCSITGFGQTGPYADRPGYDFLIQGMGGVMSLTGEVAGSPQRVGVSIADLMTGMYAAVAINAAIYRAKIPVRTIHVLDAGYPRCVARQRWNELPACRSIGSAGAIIEYCSISTVQGSGGEIIIVAR